MSERYVPPPPPYELSLQCDRKLTEEAPTVAASKESPFRDEECKGAGHPKGLLANETLSDIAAHSLSGISKHPTRSDNASLRVSRPLPPNPADINTRPLNPRGQRSKLRPAVDTKAYPVPDDHEGELHSPAPPPFSAIGPPLEEPYIPTMPHPNTSIHPYPSQPSCDTPRRHYDNRRPVSGYSPIEPRMETSSRRSHARSQSSQPQSNNFGRLSFDPSVAYANSQAGTWATFSAQPGAPASLYSPSVSSHLPHDSAVTYGSRPSFVSARPALRNTEPSRLEENHTHTYARSVRSLPPPMFPSASTSSVYNPGLRASEYGQRWATSESDITKDVYHS